MENKVWFITGASRGLGLVLVQQLLSEGYQVAATSRNLKELEKAVGSTKKMFLPIATDINNEESVDAAIQSTIQHFGQINVVVNNAGYGQLGAVEELTDAESRKNFDVNVFGSLNVIRKVLPQLRKQQAGHIFNISSIAGFTGLFPGFGIYCASKFAVDGFSESLSTEVKPFGIHVTIVSPGYFRTDFLSGGSLGVPQQVMGEYENVRAVQETHQNSYDGNQPGDPKKAAAVMIEVAKQSEPPLHLFLGQDAYNLAEAKMNLIKKDMESMRALATATNFTG